MESFIGLVAFVGLIAAAIWMNTRLSRMEREHKALLTFVLSNQHVGPQPIAPTVQIGAADAAAGASAASSAMTAGQGQDAASSSAAQASATPENVTASASAATDLLDAVPSTAGASATAEAASTPAAEASPAVAPVQPAMPSFGSVPPIAARKPRDMETALGTRWAVWVGGLALALGGVFLVRYSIEAGWFGPAARLVMAGLFGLVLMAGGEFIRRTGFKVPVEGAVAAFIPAILTAAGAFTLFSTVYAAHGVYGYIGPGVAFALLGIIGVVTMGLALVHGQALGGLGLLGALLTPLFVSSEAPNHWALFGYLAVVMVATAAVARLRLWTFLATAAFAGTGLWALIYLVTDVEKIAFSIELFICLVIVASLVVIWLGDWFGTARTAPQSDLPSIATAIPVALVALALCNDPALLPVGSLKFGVAIVLAMIGAAFWRTSALPLLFGAGFAVAMTYLNPVSGTISVDIAGETVGIDGSSAGEPLARLKHYGWMFVALFLGTGLWKARSLLATRPVVSAIWSAAAGAMPVLIVACLWATFGNLDRDYFYASAALALALVLVAGAEWIAVAEEPPHKGGPAVSLALIGSGLAAVAFFHMAFGSVGTTILIGAAAILPALATRLRRYPVLGWLCLGAALVVLGRAAIDPTVVGPLLLGTTPVFNALLPGYGIPALAFGFSAWQLARTTDGRPRLAMEASTVLFALLTVGMLVRHAMNGGVIESGELTLAEQAIYTLMAFGAGGILVAIDTRSPSVVMHVGSIAFGVLSVVMAVAQHFVLLNPLLTGESTGQLPLFNLLFLAYLLPALAAGGLALYARGRRPRWYSAMLGLLAATLAFAYATLSVRRWFQGEFISAWKDTGQLETYTYSAVWLTLGVVILVIGVWQRSYVLRAASGALIAIAVAKVFLFDMSELEGVLRALSFIGLGAVLIGIGLFYQRLLTRSAARDEPQEGAAAVQPAGPG